MDKSSESPSSLHLATKNSGIFQKMLLIPGYEEIPQNSPSFATPGSPKVSKRISRESLDILRNPMMFASTDNLEAPDSTKKRRSRCVLNSSLTICLLSLACLFIMGIVIAIVSAEIFHPRGYFKPGMTGKSFLSPPETETVAEVATTAISGTFPPSTLANVVTIPVHSDSLIQNSGPQVNLQNALSVNGPLQLFGR